MWKSCILARPHHNCPLCPPPSFADDEELPPLSAYLRPAPAKPPVENEYYIVAVSGGAVLSNDRGGRIGMREAVNSDAQRWRVVYGDGGGGGDRVAFRSVSDDRWLRLFGDEGNGVAVSTSDERQWWVLEEGISPGSCWLKCNDFPDAYLCNATSSGSDDNEVLASPRQLDQAHTFTWNLRDANAVGYDSKRWTLENPSTCDGAQTDLAARERAIAERERKLQGLEEKQSALVDKERRLIMQQADFEKIMESHRPERRVALLKAENDSLHLQLRTASLEREVEKVRERSNMMSLEQQLRKLENEKAQLQDLLHSSRQAAWLSPSPTKSRVSTPAFGSPSTGITVPSEQPHSPILRQGAFTLSKSPSSLFKQATGASSLPNDSNSPQWPRSKSPKTPTRKDHAQNTNASISQIRSDGSFGGWLQSERYAAVTPSKSSKRNLAPAINFSSAGMRQGHEQSPSDSLPPPSSVSRTLGDAASVKSVSNAAEPHRNQVSPGGLRPSSQSTPARKPPRMDSSTHGPPPAMLSLSGDDEGAVLFACGHKIFKPPRKLNKTVVGYVYE